jgi:hypothetical protein
VEQGWRKLDWSEKLWVVFKAYGWRSGLSHRAALNESFFFFLRQALDALFNFQSPASLADTLLKNQLQGASPPKIFCTDIALMFGKSALNISGNASIKAAIMASDYINIPVICILHENECENIISFFNSELNNQRRYF